MKIDCKKLKGDMLNLCIIMLGILVCSVGFTVFILPHKVVVGGMAGFSTLVYYATGGIISVAVTMYGVNLILLLLGMKVLGRKFLFNTLFGMTMMSLFVGAMEGYFTSHPPLINSSEMSTIIGAVLMGLGIGIYYSHHGTTGGTDIVAAIVSHKSDISVGRIMMIVDISIVALSFFLPFDGNLEARIQTRAQTIIMGWIAIGLYSFIADKYIYSGNETMKFLIISDKWQEIAERISTETKRGITTWNAEGYWTGKQRKVMMVCCRGHNTYSIYKIVKEVDESAYIINSPAKSIYGEGFDSLILKRHQRWI